MAQKHPTIDEGFVYSELEALAQLALDGGMPSQDFCVALFQFSIRIAWATAPRLPMAMGALGVALVSTANESTEDYLEGDSEHC